jgi:hypothetical protein
MLKCATDDQVGAAAGLMCFEFDPFGRVLMSDDERRAPNSDVCVQHVRVLVQ